MKTEHETEIEFGISVLDSSTELSTEMQNRLMMRRKPKPATGRPALAAKVQAKKPALAVVEKLTGQKNDSVKNNSVNPVATKNDSVNPKASWVKVMLETMTLDYFFDEYLEIDMPERERMRMGYVLAAWAVKAGKPKVTEMSKLGFEVRIHKTKIIEKMFKKWAKPVLTALKQD
jgi:hypothetical protein